MKKKLSILLGLLICISYTVNSQSISHFAISQSNSGFSQIWFPVSESTEISGGFIQTTKKFDIKNEQQKLKAELYPNPATDKIYFSIQNNQPTPKYLFTISNSQGKTITTKEFRYNSGVIKTSIYNNGIYFLKISEKESHKYRIFKIMINH